MPATTTTTTTVPSSGTPGAPSAVTATALNQAIALDWADNPESAVRYRVYRRSSNGTWPTTSFASPTVSDFTDTSTANGTTYTYRITAVVGSGTTARESVPSAEVSATPFAPIGGPRCGGSSAYTDAVLGSAGIAAYWRLGETTGSVACDSAGTADGAYVGGAVLGQPGLVETGGDPSVRLDGVDDHVRVDTRSQLNPTNGFTVEAWVRPTALPDGPVNFTIVGKVGQYLLRLEEQALFARLWWSDGTLAQVAIPVSLSVDAAHHFVMSYDGNALRLYDNGVLKVAKPFSGKTIDTGSQSLYIGQGGGRDYFPGLIDDVALYSVGISDDQVAAHYRAGTPLAAPGAFTAIGGATSSGLRWAPSGWATGGYNVYRGNPDGTWSLLATVPGAGATSFTDHAAPVTATYRVTARTAAGAESPPSPPATATRDERALLAAGDIAGCGSSGDGWTAQILDRTAGSVQTLGDSVYEDGSAEEFAECYDPTWGRHRWRTRAAIGGHDYRTANAGPYFSYFGAAAGEPGKGYYSYDQAGWHVIVLNTECHIVSCAPAADQGQWLLADLQAHPVPCTVAVMHAPRFSSGNVHGSSTTVDGFWRILAEGGVEVVLSGDEHVYERFGPMDADGNADPNGLRLFVVGTGGRSHYVFNHALPNSEVQWSHTYGVLKLTMNPGSYTWNFLGVPPPRQQAFTDSGSNSCH